MLIKVKLSKSQLNRISEVFGNVSVAWFTVGVIAPIFTHPQSFFDLISAFVVSFTMSIVFLILSLRAIRRIK